MIGWDSSAWWSLVFLPRANVGRWTLTFTVFAAGAPPTVAIVCQTIPHSLKSKPHCVYRYLKQRASAKAILA